jgi:hypothetical protein
LPRGIERRYDELDAEWKLAIDNIAARIVMLFGNSAPLTTLLGIMFTRWARRALRAEWERVHERAI